jgi:phosphatidate cytidylyltransferase
MLQRLLTYVGLLFSIGAILIVLIHAAKKTPYRQRKADWLKYGIYMMIIIGILLSAYLGKIAVAGLVLLIAAGGARELYTNIRNMRLPATALSVACFVVLAFFLAHLLIGEDPLWFPSFAYLFLVVSVTDSFSQLWGRLLGRHKLCPVISPAKTVEGLVGGFASAVAAAFLFQFLAPAPGKTVPIVIAVTLAASATAGDLLFSLIKRRMAIKDFSQLLPGHGGVLDRFDSLIVAAPVSYWLEILIFK